MKPQGLLPRSKHSSWTSEEYRLVAKVSMPLQSQTASGNFGGAAFQTRGGATFAGMRNGNSWPLTPKSSAQRARFKTVVGQWPQLTPAQQNSWDQDNAHALSARDIFLTCNSHLLQMGQPLLHELAEQLPDQVHAGMFFYWPDPGIAAVAANYSSLPESDCAAVLSWVPSMLNRQYLNDRKAVILDITTPPPQDVEYQLPFIPRVALIVAEIWDLATGWRIDRQTFRIVPAG
jgi:hypothetical protein